MSATISLSKMLSRRPDPGLLLVQHGWMIAAFFLLFAALGVMADGGEPAVRPPQLAVLDAGSPPGAGVLAAAPEPEALPSSLQAALDSVARRYRVSAEALRPIFSLAQFVGHERHVDPLLIVAIIGVESGFNPFAESAKGAQGLMQIVPRYHPDKLPEGAGGSALLDPAVNIRVGVDILKEAIRRNGGLEAGLQSYAGSTDPDGPYADRVLAERERLEQAARARGSA